MRRIFISYKRQDENFARELRQFLIKWEHVVWLDVVDIRPGENWDTAIHNGLLKADTVIGVLTPESVQSNNVLDEWGYALTNRKQLLLIQLRQVNDIHIPPRYIRIQRINIISNMEKGLSQLKLALSSSPALTFDTGEKAVQNPGHQTAHNQVNNSQVYEMLWDCEDCGSKKLLATTYKICPVCGKPQNPHYRYYPSDEDREQVKNHIYQETYLICPDCGMPSDPSFKFCRNCGTSLEDAKSVAPKSER
jgi:hypothetical protein